METAAHPPSKSSSAPIVEGSIRDPSKDWKALTLSGRQISTLTLTSVGINTGIDGPLLTLPGSRQSESYVVEQKSVTEGFIADLTFIFGNDLLNRLNDTFNAT